MRVRILGCGTSSGVPRIGNDWGACDPAEPKNRRRRVSILVEEGDTRILVDTTPDLREQLLDARVDTITALIWTHDHADHVHGIDDLRQLFHNAGAPVPGYARSMVLARLADRFGYVFQGGQGYPSTVEPRELEDEMTIGPVTIRAVEQPHGGITSTGLIFEKDRTRIGYSTDFSELSDDMEESFQGLDLWIADALRSRPHPSHSHLERTLACIERLAPRRAILTHMDNSMDYRSLLRELPSHIEPGFDGMEIDL